MFNGPRSSASVRKRSQPADRRLIKSSNRPSRMRNVFGHSAPAVKTISNLLARRLPAVRPTCSRARAHAESSRAEVEAQRRQRAVLDSQELMLRADLKARQAALELARTNLGYTRIVAPEDGVVGERKVRAGQLVSPGTQILSLVQHPSGSRPITARRNCGEFGRAIRLRSASTSFPAWLLKARSRRSRPPADRNSLCCLPTTPPATSPK